MIKNYEFYLSKSSQPQLLRGWEVDDEGRYSQTGDLNKWLIGYTTLHGASGFYFDFEASNSYHAVLFFSAGNRLISIVSLKDAVKQLILVPEGAAYYYVRFTSEDSAFDKIKTSDFMYVSSRINPYYKKLERKLAKDAGQEYYSESLDGQIKLVGQDFELVASSPLNTRFSLIVIESSKINSDILVYKPYYKGVFNKTNCKFDYFKKTCEPKVQTDDAYKIILDRYKEKFNLVKLGIPVTSVTCKKRPFVQIYIGEANSVTNIFNGQSWDVDVSVVPESESDITRCGFTEINYFREIYVENAAEQDVNGIYSEFRLLDGTGTIDGATFGRFRWYKKVQEVRTHYIEMVKPSSGNNDEYSIGIYAVGNSTPIYYVKDPHKIPVDMFKRKSNITGLVFFNKNNEADTFFIRKDIHYAVYGRIVHSNEEDGTKIKQDDFAAVNTKAYKYYKSLSDKDITIKQSTDSTSVENEYGANDYSKYFTPEFLPELSMTDSYMPVGKSTWANSSIWLEYKASDFNKIDNDYSTQFVLRDAYNITDVVSGLLKVIGSDITHQVTDSLFLSKPSILDGVSDFVVLITQKTNMIYGTYDQAAQKAEISLEMVLNMLRDCFRCYWYVADKSLKIEHVSYFINGRSYEPRPIVVDLTQYSDSANLQPILYGQGEISYDVSDLPYKYDFSYGDESLSPFTGVELSVTANYVQKDKNESISVNDFSADIDFMQISAEQVSQDGFALLCPKSYKDSSSGDVKYKTIVEETTLADGDQVYVTRIQNLPAAWSELVKLYSWDMPAQDVKCNVLPEYAVHGTKPIKQLSIRIPHYPNLAPFDRVKTEFLEGQIESISENIDTGYMAIDLKGQE